MGAILSTIIALATVGAGVSSHQQAKQEAGQQQAGAQHAAGVQATQAEETKAQIAEMEEKSKATAAEMKAAPGIAAEEARQESLRRRASRSKTLLTSPQGALGEANVSKKVLLGG